MSKIKKSVFLEYLLIAAVVLLGLFMCFYRLIPNMQFSGEMGRDYMDIWRMIHGGYSYLIGPRTSHEWLYLSPEVYWIYAIFLLLFNYNPVVINVVSALAGVGGVVICYFVIKKLFGKSVAIISSFLLAVSPAWLNMIRASRYNLLAAILFFLYLLYLRDSIADKGKSLFRLGLIQGLTMSSFPSPIMYIPATIVGFLFYKVKPRLKYILLFFLGFAIPNIPFLIYEVGNKFKILIPFLEWIPYRILGFVGLYHKNNVNSTIIYQNFASLYHFFANAFFSYESIPSLILFTLLAIGTIFLLFKFKKKTKLEMPFYLLTITLIVYYLAIFVHGNPPAHYYYGIFPLPVVLAAYVFSKLFKKRLVLVTATLILGLAGVFSLLTTKWFFVDQKPINYDENFVAYKSQLKLVDTIYKDSDGAPFKIKRIGVNDQFQYYFAENYIFLLTTKGAKIQNDAEILYTIIEGAKYYQNLPGTLIFSENEVFVFKSKV